MIKLQFSAQRNVLSGLIEFFEHGSYSHVDAILPDGRLLGARTSGGVAIRKPGYRKFIRTIQVVLPANPEVTEKFYSYIGSQLGKKYDFEAIFAFAIDRDWRVDDRWFCSELIAAGLEHSGFFTNTLFSEVNKITPGDLLLVLSIFVSI